MLNVRQHGADLPDADMIFFPCGSHCRSPIADAMVGPRPSVNPLPHPESLGDGHLMLWLFVRVAFLIPWHAAHAKAARWNPYIVFTILMVLVRDTGEPPAPTHPQSASSIVKHFGG